MKHHPSHRQSGFSLVEVLVALLIFSLGLLGFVGLQARAIQYSVGAEDSNRAALLANEIGSMIVASGVPTPNPAALTAWKARVSNTTGDGLPNGLGTVTTAGNLSTITLTWRATGAASGAANSQNQYVTHVIIP